MKLQQIPFSFEVYESIEDLNEIDAVLLRKSRKTTENAHAPYSNFLVGATAMLNNGEIVNGTNQENASYPLGLCAERVLLATVGSLFPNEPIEAMAISYHALNGKSDVPISPCGLCRQSLFEYEKSRKHPIRLILSGMEGRVYVVEKASYLLPLSFSDEFLK